MPVAVSAPAWARPYEPATARADASVALVAQSTVGFVMLALQGAFGPPITVPVRSPVAVVAVVALGGGTLLAYLGLLGAALAVPMWMHRCYRNLPALGSRGYLSPAWAAGCWFVPIANLVLPYVAVRDIWAASRPGERWNVVLVATWWIAWLAAWGLLVTNGRFPGRGYVDLISSALMAGAGALFISIVHLITRGQRLRAAVLT